MFGYGVALAIAASAAILLTLLITLAVRRCYHFSKQGTKVSEATTTTTTTTTQNRRNMEGIASQSQSISIFNSRTRPSYNLFRRGSSTKPLFSWADHPSLIADAVENGWSRFAFTNYFSSPSTTKSSLLGFVGDQHHNQRENQVEIAWEVGQGSVDFMQKIRMNPGFKKLNLNSSSIAAKSAIRTALPLPGPPMGNPYSFPQEAYFEITLLSVSSSSLEGKVKAEGEKTKLIGDGKGNLDALNELDRPGVMISMGLTSSTLVPLKTLGSYHGSIGFNSDGSVHLDGTKLALESEREDWGQEEKVIGCGFDPRQKKVFFTADSKLVDVVHCKSEEFGTPLYPVIVANADITVVVNMGQSSFLYEPANELRTPNPCFIGPLVRSQADLRYDDSGELFSMGRIDSGWHHNGANESRTNSGIYSWQSGTHNDDNGNYNGYNGSKVSEEDDESEADLFEIVLDVKGKSQIV